MASKKPFLLVYGATGATGNVVVEGLLQSGAFVSAFANGADEGD
jgi:short subunit dehydrogenase-like uncharacterized protein